jgi:hypothetical protein
MTREEIKQLLESKGLDVNVRLQGDQTHFKITLKKSFEVAVKDISSKIILEITENRLRKLAQTQIWNMLENLK